MYASTIKKSEYGGPFDPDAAWFFGYPRCLEVRVTYQDDYLEDPDTPDLEAWESGDLLCCHVTVEILLHTTSDDAVIGRADLGEALFTDFADFERLGPSEYFEDLLREALEEAFDHLHDFRTLANALIPE